MPCSCHVCQNQQTYIIITLKFLFSGETLQDICIYDYMQFELVIIIFLTVKMNMNRTQSINEHIKSVVSFSNCHPKKVQYLHLKGILLIRLK